MTHARFVTTYRVANDQRLLGLFGPAGSARRRANRYLVVASQVVVISRPLIRTPLQQIAFMVGVGLVVAWPMFWLFGTPYGRRWSSARATQHCCGTGCSASVGRTAATRCGAASTLRIDEIRKEPGP